MPSPKPVHGAPLPPWVRFRCHEHPPVPTQYQIRQKVIYRNDYGVEFEMEVVGFAKDDSLYGRFIHLIRHGTNGDGSAWWFPHHPSELKPCPGE